MDAKKRVECPKRKEKFLWKSTRGSTVLEFALVAPLLFMIIIFMFEEAMVFTTVQIMDASLANATRLVEIGTITTQNDFVTAVCSQASLLITSCSSKLQVSVTSAATCSGITPPTISGGNLTPSGFTPPAASNCVLSQIAYKRSYTVPFISAFAGANGATLLSSVSVTMEP